MRPHVVWLVLLLHMILLILMWGGINALGLAMLLMMPTLVLTGAIAYRTGKAQASKPLNVADHPSCFWRA